MKSIKIIPTKISSFLISVGIIFMTLSPLYSLGSHLVGGNLGYEYLGPDSANPGNHRYKINLDVYLDCNSSGWVGNGGNSFPEHLAQVGIFEGLDTPASPIFFSQSLNLVLTDSNQVQGNLPITCNPLNLISTLCVYLIHYEKTVSLPASSSGYWIINDRCCRPPGMLNIVNSGQTANTFTTWIPASNGSLLPNSSPQFTDTLVTYICLGDSSFVSNSATDPDGDSLVYSLESSYSGVTSTFTPATTYNSTLLNPYSIPPPVVAFQPGYSLANLLGPGGISTIDVNTGLTTFLANNQGKYVASIEIKEYRSGQLVGVSRRNMQLICDNCPNNNGPTQNTSNLDSTATSPTNYEIDAGTSFCFDLTYTDPENDPLEFTAVGDIFNSSLTNPVANVTSPITGTGTVNGTICWNTTCAQGKNDPYLLTVTVSDSNCPPKPIIQQVAINVQPFIGPQKIFGDSFICVNGNIPHSFSADTISNISYNWNITGGTILSGNNSPTIEAIWNSGQSNGLITLSTTNQNGCISDTISKTISLFDVTADAGKDTSFCIGSSVVLGGVITSANILNSIRWIPSTGLTDSTVSNPIAFPSSTTAYVVQLTNPSGCIGYDTIVVQANTPTPSGLDSSYYLCPGDTALMLVVGDSFIWSPNSFISDTSISNPQIYPPANQEYRLHYFDANGCEGIDTTFFTVNGSVPTNAGIDANICMGDSAQLGGNPTSPTGATFLWSPAINMNNNTVSNPSVLPITNTWYTVITNNDTCSGIDSVLITILTTPVLTVSPDTFVCVNDTTQLFANGNGTFEWNNGNTLTDSTISDPLAFPKTKTLYTVIMRDTNSCIATDSILVDIKPLPFADAGNTVEACKFLPAPMGGNPTGPFGSTYIWTPNVSLNFNGLANPLVTRDSDKKYVVQVTDTNGCISFDSVSVQIFRTFGNFDTTICDSQEVFLNSTTLHGTEPFKYSWTPSNLVSDSTSNSPSIITGQSPFYNVIISDSNNCKDTVYYNINSLQSSIALFSYSLIPTCTGIGIKTINESIGAIDYTWLLSGTTVSTAFDPVIVIDYNSTANLTLITSSPDGCMDSINVVITGSSFDELLNIEVSNVFTPNGDGMNDYFEISSNGELGNCIELQIFNRNGAIVFESTGGTHTWDGYSDVGKAFPDGVYFYVYTINGKEYHGSLTLMR